jgi:hypothetical protein
MNERLKELITETHLFSDYETVDGRQQKIYGFTKDGIEKFAELIVRECANIANAGIDPTESHLIGDDILEHFGVES